MKWSNLFLTALALAMWTGAPLRAQDAPVSPAASPDATPAVPGSTPAPASTGGLFPDTGPALPQGGERHARHGAGEKAHNRNRGHSRDMAEEKADMDPLDVRVAYRRDKTLAMERDPGLADLLREAAAAPTDKDKRAWLKQYYDRLYAGIRKIDPSPAMKAHLALIAFVTEQRWNPQRRAVAGEEDLVNGRRGRRH